MVGDYVEISAALQSLQQDINAMIDLRGFDVSIASYSNARSERIMSPEPALLMLLI
jgi:hypothetical protein